MAKDSKKSSRIRRYSFAAGHKVSAHEAYLRSSNYYRTAEFLLMDPEDPRIQATWGSSREKAEKQQDFSRAHALNHSRTHALNQQLASSDSY